MVAYTSCFLRWAQRPGVFSNVATQRLCNHMDLECLQPSLSKRSNLGNFQALSGLEYVQIQQLNKPLVLRLGPGLRFGLPDRGV